MPTLTQLILLSVCLAYSILFERAKCVEFSWNNIGLVLKILFLSIVISAILYIIRFKYFNFFYDTSKFTNISDLSFYTLIFSPIVEETVFRGMILKLLKKYSNILLSIFFSSILFTIFHKVPFYLDIFILSFGLGYIYTKFGIWYSVATHFAYNLILPITITFVLRIVQ